MDPDKPRQAQQPIKFKRVLLKISGEGLCRTGGFGIDGEELKRIGAEVRSVHELGCEVAVVVGGGNIFRGAGLAQSGIDRVTGDHMGMLATVMNALALQDALESIGTDARVMSAVSVHDVCEDYIRRRAIRHLEKGRVVVCAGGTGNPFFTTDTAAALRAIEVGADIVLKATKVDGVYSADPAKHPEATFYDALSYDQVIEDKLGVMDTNAIVLCRDQGMPIRVFNVYQEGNLMRLVQGESIGTLVS